MSIEVTTILIESTGENGSHTAYHRDFPEIRACGCSATEAVVQLGHQLTRALDSALTDWRRETLQAALADAKAYGSSAL